MEPYLPNLSASARRWARFAVLLAALTLLGAIVYRLRSVFTPMLVALAIAYVLNPLVTWLEREHRVYRLTTVIVVFLLFGAIVVGGGFLVGNQAVTEVRQLSQNLGGYVETLDGWIRAYQARTQSAESSLLHPAGGSATTAPTSVPTTVPFDWWATAAPLVREYGTALASTLVNQANHALLNIFNLISLLVLVPMFTFFFLWRFNDLVGTIRDHLPSAWRPQIVHVVTVIDRAIADFFRGRLVICLIVGVLCGIGWSATGVPYALLLGLVLGMLNLVPFLSLLVLPPALLFAYLGAVEGGGSSAWALILALGVFLGVNAVEAFLLNPYVLGRSAGLHPITIVVALLVGGELAGLLGLLLAIPVASTLRTLAAEYILPEVRRLAGLAHSSPRGPDPQRPAAQGEPAPGSDASGPPVG